MDCALENTGTIHCLHCWEAGQGWHSLSTVPTILRIMMQKGLFGRTSLFTEGSGHLAFLSAKALMAYPCYFRGWTKSIRDFRNVRLHQKQSQEATDSCEMTETKVEDKRRMMAGVKLGRPAQRYLSWQSPVLENLIPGDAMMHSSTSSLSSRRKKALVSWGTASLCRSFHASNCQICVPILLDATAAGLPRDVVHVVFREQCSAFLQSLVWQDIRGVEQCQPPRPVCPVALFLFGWTDVQKGNIKCWHINKHIKILGGN